ncbi:ABC transporter permease [Piscinibacter sp.]|jgi:putative ABC transport system permease protein|uniref:ABC transporter permease n=1 Tax=Piscinibacter sp. TaxID=1903157 RepID=UPI00355A9C5C
MLKILKIALRNLARFHRRTLLTSTLITLGIVAVLLFIATAGSFKAMMIGQFTDAVLGHLEVHRKGYVASIDNLPLNLNMQPTMVRKVEQTLDKLDGVQAYSERVKFGAMFSNFTETTSVRVNGIDPDKETATTPLMPGRIVEGSKQAPLLKPGEILIPTLLSRGMNVKLGDTIVLVATNRDGSVNGKTFVVRGIMEAVSGPSGRDAYIGIADARTLLRMTEPEVSEIAIRLRDPGRLDQTYALLSQQIAALTGQGGQPGGTAQPGKGGGGGLEVHTWAALSPFSNIANMIDLLTVFIKIMLVSIVLISILNVMVMAVYERIREIGTIAAIGTPPRRILALFLTEGLLLGVGGAAVGTAISLVAIYALNVRKLTFDFGMQQGLVLSPSISVRDVATIAGLVVLMALLASLQPAWKASRMDPVRALGHV